MADRVQSTKWAIISSYLTSVSGIVVLLKLIPSTYPPTVPIFDFQNLQRSERPDFLEFQSVNISVF